jgi:hypothetical protein
MSNSPLLTSCHFNGQSHFRENTEVVLFFGDGQTAVGTILFFGDCQSAVLFFYRQQPLPLAVELEASPAIAIPLSAPLFPVTRNVFLPSEV